MDKRHDKGHSDVRYPQKCPLSTDLCTVLVDLVTYETLFMDNLYDILV